ncbi:5-dehydro-4-deoxyglucarate dehydratase [Sinomonas sp. P10A9]|uniref:Probable 5-dehydro-4-deoxyglucarate dehydratase n=1 Tax=Sinomonas puerhi TaxID=3238584 RepID=A0AB39L1N1_9MICC
MATEPAELAAAIGSGLLSFPVTPFTADLALDEGRFREHMAWLAEWPVAGLFAGGGTGEGFSLTASETDALVRAAVAEVGGKVPVLAPATGATVNAVAQAKAAAAAGADGIFLMPPYLTESDQEGLAAHVRAVAEATDLGVVFYNRANARLDATTLDKLAAELPTLVAFKDGVGDLNAMVKIYATLGDRLTYIGGLPTAETVALPYLELGFTTYSSAIFNFIPEFAVGFYQDVRAKDAASVYRKINDFFLPYLDIRDRRNGYGVSIIKAGLRAIGRPAGPVRPPLQDLTDTELAELTALVERINADRVK